MVVDAIDRHGRRYLEVEPRPEIAKIFEHHEPEPCIECGIPIKHGLDRYFQRNEPSDGKPDDDSPEGRMQAVLMSITYDAVCGHCGDKAIKEGAA